MGKHSAQPTGDPRKDNARLTNKDAKHAEPTDRPDPRDGGKQK